MVKKLLTCAAIALCCGSVMAQTDVTSTYLDNAGFDVSTDFITTAVCTYAKDVASNSADGSSLMAVSNWTAGDTGDAKAGGCFGFGSNAWVATSTAKVPATNSAGEAEGGALGLGGCWNGNAYYTQALKQKLAAGTYTVEIMGYNAGSTTAFGTQAFGIKESGGKTHYVTTTWTAGAWTKATVSFELSAETEATFYVGATGVAGGSANSAKLFIDYVKIYKAKSLQDLMNEATESNPADVTSFYLQNAAVTGTDGWTNGRINSGEQYTSAPDNTYLDAWNATYNMSQNATLKPGKYTLKAATRAIAGIETANIYANVKDGANNNTAITAVGNTDGDLGNGWGWTTVNFNVLEETEVTIGFYSECGGNKWAGADNFSLLYRGAYTEEEKCLALVDELQKAANDREIPGENEIGDGVFMYSNDAVTELKRTMQAFTAYSKEELVALLKSKEMFNETAIKELINTVNNAQLPLKAPSDTQAYKIILKYDGWNYNNCAMTPMVGSRSDMGGYNVQYKAKNPNYAQSLFFTPVSVEGKQNTYTISFTDAEGNTRYISTGTPHGGNASQIRTTTTADDALVVEVRRNGDYIQLYNTAANQFIGSQDAGVFTVNSHTDFVVEETKAKNAISKTVAAGKYATVVLPYAADANNAYKVSISEDGETVELTAVTSLEANKAYILGAGEYNFSGVNIAYEEPKEDSETSSLVGVFTDTQVPVNRYVLQTKDNVQKFYQVTTEGGQPTLSANKAYLFISTGTSEAKALNIGTSEDTAIKAIDALTSGDAKIYDINGRELKSLQKGINVVNGVKVLVK